MLKYFNGFLKPYRKLVLSHFNDAVKVGHKLKDSELSDGKVAVIFDVVFLYTSVPFKDGLTYIHW